MTKPTDTPHSAMIGMKFEGHYSISPIQYRVIREEDGAFVVVDESGNERLMHRKILEGYLRSEESK